MSAIDWADLRSLTSNQNVAALLRDGFALWRQSGSHRRLVHSDGRRVTVSSHHPGQTFPPKTLRSMLEEQARRTTADLRRLKLLR
jgi:predicted RNA binding protein YcfA (HicA-like mRNA interferase family)